VWFIFVLLAGAMTVQVTCFHRPQVATSNCVQHSLKWDGVMKFPFVSLLIWDRVGVCRCVYIQSAAM